MERVRRLTADDLPAARAMWTSTFGDSPAFTDWFFMERYRPETSLCLEKDGRIVSLIHGCPMQVRVRDAVLPGLMLCGVATLPQCRGRGYMHRVMAAMLRLAREMGIPLVLHTPVSFQTYASLGQLPCTDALRWTAPDTAPGAPPSWDPFPSVEALTACYTQALSGYSGAVLRTEADMARKLMDYRSDGGRCLTVHDDGALAGYLIAQPAEGGAWDVPEIAAASPALYEALLGRLPRGSAAKLPPDLPLPGKRLPQGIMGVSDAARLLAMACGDEALTFAVTDSFLPENTGVFDGLGRPTARPPRYALTAGQLMQLLCGYALCDTRFPARPCYCVDEY